MVNKKIAGSLFVFLILISSVYAITGSIGNAKMILRAETGDEIEKYVLVKNVNNVSVNIEVEASGNLSEWVEVKDEAFTLAPGTEKRAYFVIDVKEEGQTTGTIDIKFSPLDDGNGVGLMSTVIVIAEKGSWFGGDDEDDDDGGWFGGGDEDEGDSSEGGSAAVVILAVVLIILLILVITFFYLLMKINSKARKKEAKLKRKSVKAKPRKTKSKKK
jgi:Na+-transporting methylmalonyl-CoA/oxaloacetate decarboxylase gamma subunit